MIPAACASILAIRHPDCDHDTAYRLSRQHGAVYLTDCADAADQEAVSVYEYADLCADEDAFAAARSARRDGAGHEFRAATLRAAADLVGVS